MSGSETQKRSYAVTSWTNSDAWPLCVTGSEILNGLLVSEIDWYRQIPSSTDRPLSYSARR